MGLYPPPTPFRPEPDADAASWLDPLLYPHEHRGLVGFVVPSGYESYARILHPCKRSFGDSVEQMVPLRWSEIATARGKTMHPQVALAALIDNPDPGDYKHWKAISVGGGEWFPPYEWLEQTEALALVSLLQPFTASSEDAWFMLWDGYGDLGRAIDGLPRGTIHRVEAPPEVPAELEAGTWAYRHYIVLRGPLDAMSTWFAWRSEGPNYLWPDDRSWIVVTELDGFSTYVGGTRQAVGSILGSPFLEGVPCTRDGVDPLSRTPSR